VRLCPGIAVYVCAFSVYRRACMYVRACVCAYRKCERVHAFVCAYVRVCMCVCVRARESECVRVCIGYLRMFI
jgi:hypothetical protein